MADDIEDHFFSRQTNLTFHRTALRFDLARTVFASATLDPGSMLLLRYLQALPLAGGERILDLGCGHGTLGIVLQALDSSRHVVSVDRDALALRYAARNRALNDLSADNHRIIGSLGYDALAVPATQESQSESTEGSGHRFDLIVSNVPGKAGESVITDLVARARHFGNSDTLLALVVVAPLVPLVDRVVDQLRLERVLTKGNKQYEVFVLRLGEEAQPTPVPLTGSFADGVYDRHRKQFRSGSLSWDATTVTGLDEFDSLAYPTRLLRTALQGINSGPSIVIEPGQGHRALVAARAGYPPAVVLSRDLLSLQATERLLIESGVDGPDLIHDVSIDAVDQTLAGTNVPVILLHGTDKVHGPWFVDQVERCIKRFRESDMTRPCDLVMTGRAGPLGRLEADVLRRRKGHLAYKQTERGFRALRFRVTPAGAKGSRPG